METSNIPPWLTHNYQLQEEFILQASKEGLTLLHLLLRWKEVQYMQEHAALLLPPLGALHLPGSGFRAGSAEGETRRSESETLRYDSAGFFSYVTS